jgi:hypothetical protein
VLDQLPGVVELEAGSDGLDETAAQAQLFHEFPAHHRGSPSICLPRERPYPRVLLEPARLTLVQLTEAGKSPSLT